MRPWTSALLVVIVALAAPTVIAYVGHVTSFAGVCGPHAPDIPARPCSHAEYMAEFGAGFAGAGLLLLTIAATPIAAVLGILAYALHRRAIRPRGPDREGAFVRARASRSAWSITPPRR